MARTLWWATTQASAMVSTTSIGHGLRRTHMSYRWILALASPVLLFSQSVTAANCDSIITHGLRNISVSASKEVLVASTYLRNCGKISDKSSETELLQAEIEIFGSGKGGGEYSKEKRVEHINEWCNTSKSTYDSNNQAAQHTQTFYQGL
jgi:hypothetical protein